MNFLKMIHSCTFVENTDTIKIHEGRDIENSQLYILFQDYHP